MAIVQRIDHVGILVRSVDASIGYFTDVLGMELVADEVRPDGSVRLAYLAAGDTVVQLVEPLVEGPSAEHLRTYGEGLHHICFGVADLSETLACLPGEDGASIELGGRGARVAFLGHRPSQVLVELAE